MGSLLERLDAREQATQTRVEGIREQIAALNEQLGEAERELERLRIGRAVLAEVLAEEDTTRESAAGTPSAGPVAVGDGTGVRPRRRSVGGAGRAAARVPGRAGGDRRRRGAAAVGGSVPLAGAGSAGQGDRGDARQVEPAGGAWLVREP